MIKSSYIKNILDLLLNGDEIGKLFSSQLEYIVDDEYEYTKGNGLFVYFKHTDKIETFRQDNDELVIDGVTITSIDKNIEANAILFIKKGVIDNLEIWCVTGNYPNTDLDNYIATQDWVGSPGRQIVVENK